MTARSRSTRRSFIQTAGAVLAAPVATAVPAFAHTTDEADPEAQLASFMKGWELQGVVALFVSSLHTMDRTIIPGLFADPSGATIDPNLRRLHIDCLDLHYLGGPSRCDTAEVSLRCEAEFESVIEPRCPLVDMARAQGGGRLRRVESGFFDMSFVRVDNRWKIANATFIADDVSS